MLENFYIIFAVLQKIIAIKDAILHLNYTRPTDGIYPILWGKKWTRFLAIYS